MPQVKPASTETKQWLARLAPKVKLEKDTKRPGLYIGRHIGPCDSPEEWQHFIERECSGVRERAKAEKIK